MNTATSLPAVADLHCEAAALQARIDALPPSELADCLCVQHVDLEEQIIGTPARSPAELAIKLRLLADELEDFLPDAWVRDGMRACLADMDALCPPDIAA